MFRSAPAIPILLPALLLLLSLPAAAQQSPPPLAPAAPATALSTQTDGGAKTHHPSRSDRDRAQKLFLEGAKAIEDDRPRAAMDSFSRAAELNPADKRYQESEQIAREHVVTDLIQQADKARILGHFAEAHSEVAEAFRVDPSDPILAQHLDELGSEAATTPTQTLHSASAAPPIRLQPKPVRLSFHLRDNERNLIAKVLPAYGVQPTLDDSVGVAVVRFDVDNVDFAQAEQALSLATNTFLVPLDPSRALAARDDRANHDKYEREGVETLYLPEISSEELTGLVQVAKDFFAARVATATSSRNAITVRAPAAELPALNATLTGLIDGSSQVQLDVRMFEVDRTKAVNLGLILPNQTTLFNVYSEARTLLNSNSSLVQEIISSGLAAPGDWEAILGLLVASGQISSSIFTQPFGVFGGGLTMTGIVYQGGSLNMQLNSSDVRALDQIQLRVDDRQEATIKAGERYPIETSSYSSLSPSSLSIPGLTNPGLSSTLQNLGVSASALENAASALIPQVQYQDIGLTLGVTPYVEAHDVSLKFHLTLSSLGGSSLNGLPVLNNREYSAITSIPIGQTAVLLSSLSRQESNAITGIPGLSEIPGLQDATNTDTNLDIGELVVVITPHVVRSSHQQATEKMIVLPHEPGQH
ncbi:MAG TPA: hypothetical protein VHX37_02725 [Acidobacteriaceae bacterium]|jgi:Flp pilus assembly secretin CpaC|nr:hypothetical protein [Acidobacteriaceae bacterium]